MSCSTLRTWNPNFADCYAFSFPILQGAVTRNITPNHKLPDQHQTLPELLPGSVRLVAGVKGSNWACAYCSCPVGACALRRAGPWRLWAGPGCSSVLGPRSCGRSRRPHRGNRSAAAAPPCRPRDCHRLGCEGTLAGSPEVAPPDSQTPPSSPRRYRRRHARRGRQIPQKVTTRAPPWTGPQVFPCWPWVVTGQS